MRRFRVWAPAPGRVELVLGERCESMERRRDGWWEASVDTGPGDVDYGFLVDGQGPFPDPRSPRQPEGVHGRSRTVDHGRFMWNDVDWRAPSLSSALVYELHVGTFTREGTFAAVVERLPHLKDLGVTHVELMPVAAFPGTRSWGYDGATLFAPYEGYGGPEGLKHLVDACHVRGLAVILDVVYNHLGPEGNYLDRFGPYFTRRYGTPWGPAMNLDGPGSDEVRRFICDNALMWLRDYHLDGLRIDAVHAFHDLSAIHILEQLSMEVEALSARTGRSCVLVAESDLNDPRVVRSREAGGLGADAQWSDDLHHALHAAVTGESVGYYRDFGGLAPVAKALEGVFVLDGCHSVHRGRRHGRPPTGLSGDRFLGYLQTHDQVGNRARGERIGALAGTARQQAAAAFVLLGPFVPMVFQGEEWAAGTPFRFFCDYQDPAVAKAVREGRRAEFADFGWNPEQVPDPQDPDTFAASRLRWEEREHPPHREMLAWYKALVRLRRQLPELTDARLDTVRCSFDEEPGWLRMVRGRVTVACNLGPHSVDLPLVPENPSDLLLSSQAEVRLGSRSIELPPDATVVLGPATAPDVKE